MHFKRSYKSNISLNIFSNKKLFLKNYIQIKYENASNKTIKEKEKSDQDKKEDDSEVND